MTRTTWTAGPNPAYPSKGQRPWCITVARADGTLAILDQQYNKQTTATREAYAIQARHDMRSNHRIYLGD